MDKGSRLAQFAPETHPFGTTMQRFLSLPVTLMRQAFQGFLRRSLVVLVVIAIAGMLSQGKVENSGDNLQVALPLLAWGCSIANGDGVEYLGRYLAMFAAAHGAKRVFGDARFNIRPNGGGKGMPSAHTSTAALGASRLVGDCLKGNFFVQSAVVLAGGWVGASRIVAGAHTIWQVLFGAILGLVCDRAAGRGSRLRRWIQRLLRLG